MIPISLPRVPLKSLRSLQVMLRMFCSQCFGLLVTCWWLNIIRDGIFEIVQNNELFCQVSQ